MSKIPIENIIQASYRLKGIAEKTPLQRNLNLSDEYEANIYLKREDLQIVRSYKIRGAYNLMSQLSKKERKRGVVCASAGNHAQGFAYSCYLLDIDGEIYMPTTTPAQKIDQCKRLGKKKVKIILTGDTFDAAKEEAIKYCEASKKVFVPPFEHPLVMEGQGTVGVEILNQFKGQLDYLFVPIGGGGLCAGIVAYFQKLSPKTKIIGVEPAGAPAMLRAKEAGEVVKLAEIDTFVDGAAVKQVGELTFEICIQGLYDLVVVPEGKICTFILQMYNKDAIVVEPAGALAIAALDRYRKEIKGKNVVCIVSGGNNDIERMPDIRERSLIFEGLKHYFIIQFPQRAGALREFLDNILGADDDIAYFEYSKKNNRTKGPALVGIELKNKADYEGLIRRMDKHGVQYTSINKDRNLFNFLL